MTSRVPYLIFIANPKAGGGKTLYQWPSIQKAMELLKWKYEIYWSQYSRHSVQLASDAVNYNPDYIIAFGGDGTVHEVFEGAYHVKEKLKDTALTAFPIGTGNDWSRYWKIPRKINEWTAMILQGKIYLHDVGKVAYVDEQGRQTSSLFINVAGMAYDAYVAHFIESKKKKMKMGGMQYLYFIFRCLFGYSLQESMIHIKGKKLKDKFYTINVGICPYSGGGLQIVPQADPTDGLLAFTAVRPVNKFQVIWLSRHFYSGKLLKSEHIIHDSVTHLEVTPGMNEKIKLEADGEYLGNLPASFSVLPKALKICAP